MQNLQNKMFIFLDRDGVINRKPPEGEYVERWEDFHILPGVEQAVAVLNTHGKKVIVVTNQRGVALGKYRAADVEFIHQKLQEQLANAGGHIDAFYYCPHDREECDCRKPKPGLILQAFHDFPEANAANSVIIGDSLSDLEAGHSLGMPSIFIDGPRERQKPGAEQARSVAGKTCHSLAEAVDAILRPQRIKPE
ncbi:histidinol-phosphate phosphatase family protein [Acidobacterium capsulatum ATCC 51196]|uniref:D,D-heptose 1,7-bisphosphate phosphatase n=2 Tax=Acidobacteriaceae TaxID=204434 RepID=C1F285_ACIC5|nr:histidinol-phosphate phosphatase family protein [Acidobacterium capsulatum ATCC 51196]